VLRGSVWPSSASTVFRASPRRINHQPVVGEHLEFGEDGVDVGGVNECTGRIDSNASSRRQANAGKPTVYDDVGRFRSVHGLTNSGMELSSGVMISMPRPIFALASWAVGYRSGA
jgi:hypothetical protein